jgi:hypothetical protein
MPFSRTGYELRMNALDAMIHALCDPLRLNKCPDPKFYHSTTVFPSVERLGNPFNTSLWSSYVVDLLEQKTDAVRQTDG